MKLLKNVQLKKFLIPLLALVAVFLPLLYLFTFVFPCFDDYWYAFVAKKEGFWHAQSWWYFNWGGRYLSTLIESLNVLIYKQVILYRILVFLLFSAFVSSSFLLVKNFVRYFFENSKVLILILFTLFISFFLASLPGFSEFVYWSIGANYSVGITFINIFALFLFFKKDLSTYSRYSVLFFISVLACGTSEFSSFLVLSLLGLAFIIDYSFHKKSLLSIIKSFEFALFFFTGLFAYFVILRSPGNHIRYLAAKQLYVNAGSLSYAIKYGIINLANYVYNIFFVRQGLLLFVITAFAFNLLRKSNTESDGSSGRKYIIIWLVIQLILIGLSALFTIMYIYNQGLKFIMPRSLAFLSFIWTANIIFSGAFFGSALYFKNGLSSVNKVLVTIFFLLFCNLVFFSSGSNIKRAYTDIYTHKVIAYNNYYKEQRTDFLNCLPVDTTKNSKDCNCILYVWDLSDQNYKTPYLQFYQEVLCNKTK